MNNLLIQITNSGLFRSLDENYAQIKKRIIFKKYCQLVAFM